jgi:Protein of unknown function (DUF3987)
MTDIQTTARELLNAGFLPVPTIFSNDPKPKKPMGFLENGQKVYIRLSYKQITASVIEENFERWFSDTLGIGVISDGNPSLRGTYLNRIDVDTSNFQGSGDLNRIISDLTIRFKDLPCWGFRTISGGFAVLFECRVDLGVQKISYDGIYVGDTSKYNVIPPSYGYTVLWQNELEPISLEVFKNNKIEFSKIETVAVTEVSKELGIFCRALDQLLLAFQFDRVDPWPTGYDDSYESWNRLMLITRGLEQKFNSIEFRNKFIEFSYAVGALSGKELNLEALESDFDKEDSEELGIATLVNWVKSIWDQGVPEEIKDQVLEYFNSNKEEQKTKIDDKAKQLNSMTPVEREIFLSEVSRAEQNQITVKEKENQFVLFGNESLKEYEDLVKTDIDINAYLPGVIANALNEFSDNIKWRKDSVLMAFLGSLSGVWRSPTTLKLRNATNFKVTPNLYVCIAAPTGSGKTPVGENICKNGLKEIQKNLNYEYQIRLETWEQEDKKNRGIRPRPPMIVSNGNPSIEGLIADMTAYPNLSNTMIWDELSGFFSMESYSGQKATIRGFYLSAYEGLVGYTASRKADPISLVNCQLSITGFIQDAKLGEHLNTKNFEDGLIPRFLFVQNPPELNIEDDVDLTSDLETLIRGFFVKAHRIANKDLVLSNEAKVLFDEFYKTIDIAKFDMDDPLLVDILGKAKGQVGKLAMNLHLAKSVENANHDFNCDAVAPSLEMDKFISFSTMNSAIALYQQCYEHLQRLLLSSRGTNSSSDFILYTEKIKKSLIRKPNQTAREIRQNLICRKSKLKAETLNLVLKALMDSDRIGTQTVGKRVELNWVR